MGETNTKKRPISLDFLNEPDGGGDLPELVIVKKPATDPPPPPMTTTVDECTRQSLVEEYKKLSDQEIEATLNRKRRTLATAGSNLPDNGKKIRVCIELLEAERERGKVLRAQKAADEREKTTQSIPPELISDSDDMVQDNPSSDAPIQSKFGSLFSKKMDAITDWCADDAFDKEFSALGHRNCQKEKPKRGLSSRGRQKAQSSTAWPFLAAGSLSRGRFRHGRSDVDKNGRVYSSHTFYGGVIRRSNGISKQKDGCHLPTLNGSNPTRRETLVLLDEDESQLEETTKQEFEFSERMKDVIVYYPSRDDPESVEICFKDLACLGPEAFLTSPIMNFYMRYLRLQASSTKKAICDYHFFNTFFYNKLEQAASHKGNDKEFIKLRRWWKGVNIFQKAYVLIPIHETLHWSLVIICIPDEEDESGPIILHLDSLQLHDSKSVFTNVNRFLTEEWSFIDQEVAPSDLPFSKEIWENLPRTIEGKVIRVPQQKNDYDCGLFVLYFMELFIKEAPERLKREDLSMFCQRWFRPEEASYLRVKMHNILGEKFVQASWESEFTPVSSSSP